MLSTDKRWKQLGEVLANYCLEVKPGKKVIIAQYEIESWPLALATYEAVIKAGGKLIGPPHLLLQPFDFGYVGEHKQGTHRFTVVPEQIG